MSEKTLSPVGISAAQKPSPSLATVVANRLAEVKAVAIALCILDTPCEQCPCNGGCAARQEEAEVAIDALDAVRVARSNAGSGN